MSDSNNSAGGADQMFQKMQDQVKQTQIQSYPGNDPGPINR